MHKILKCLAKCNIFNTFYKFLCRQFFNLHIWQISILNPITCIMIFKYKKIASFDKNLRYIHYIVVNNYLSKSKMWYKLKLYIYAHIHVTECYLVSFFFFFWTPINFLGFHCWILMLIQSRISNVHQSKKHICVYPQTCGFYSWL